MQKRILILLVVVVLSITGWLIFRLESPKEPEFREIRNAELLNVQGNEAEIFAEVVFYNPNRFGITLLNTDLRVLIDDEEVARLTQTIMTDIRPHSEFTLPLRCKADLLKLGLSQTLSGMLLKLLDQEKRKFRLRLSGTCRFKNRNSIVRLPIDHEESISIR